MEVIVFIIVGGLIFAALLGSFAGWVEEVSGQSLMAWVVIGLLLLGVILLFVGSPGLGIFILVIVGVSLVLHASSYP